jgi:multiple sugar transport system substrate-binding protein
MRVRRDRASVLGFGAAAVAAVATLLTGCSSSSGSADGGVTIRYLTHWGPDQVKQLQAVAAAFHKDHPKITVKFQAVPFANLLSTVQTQGASSNGPTITGIYDLWLPQLIKSGIAAKAPSDVSGEVASSWPKNLVADVSDKGSVYGVPNEVDLYALNYNKKLFADAGISAPPTTWDELVADAKKLTNKAKGQQGFGVITNWAAGVDHPFLSLAASNGGTFLTSAKSKSNLTSANVVDTAKLYEQLVKDGSTNASMSAANANTTGPYLDNFANGKTAMLIMANWWESSLKQAMGDRFQDVATAPIPVGPKGSKSSSVSYSWLTMVNAHASDAAQKAAWQFLQYLNGPTSGKNGSSAMGDILLGMGILPSRTSDLAAHQSDLSDPFVKTYVDGISAATPFPTVVGGAAASDALQKSIEDLVFGRASAEGAMQTADKAVNSALNSAK